jgi:DNA-binding PadR family transcriptional regulator
MARLAVLATLLEDPSGEHYGLAIAKSAQLATGTVYPILARLEADGWVESEWEAIDEVAEGRRRRRYYTMTPLGARAAEAERRSVARVVEQGYFSPGLAGGLT